MKYENEKKLKRDPRVRSYTSPNGDKKYRVTFKKTINGKAIRFEKQGLKTANEATSWAEDELAKALLRHGREYNYTLQLYYDFWHEKNVSNGYWKADTQRNYENIFNNYILPRFGEYKLINISRDEFQLFVNDLQSKPRKRSNKIGYSTSTINTIKVSLAALLNDAVYSNHLDVNRVKGIHIKQGQGKRNLKISPEKFKEALDTAQQILEPMPYAAFMLTTIGLRHGEVLGLRFKDIFQDHIEIRISRTQEAPEGTTPKTASSIRDVPITLTIYNILNKAMFVGKQFCYEHDIDWNSDTFLIMSEDAKPLHVTVMNYYFKRVSDKIDFHIFPHMMRHAFATFAIPLADSTKDVSNVLGHSEVSMSEYYDTGTDAGAFKVIQDVENRFK